MIVGTVVKLKVECLNNEPGTIGVVYEVYDIGNGLGASVIFPNGEYDGFSQEEQELMLEEVGQCDELSDYQFRNVMQLSQDFDSGVFHPVFLQQNFN